MKTTIHGHSNQCTMAFGRYTKEPTKCLRCDELRAGATPRAGWQKDYFAKKKADAARFSRELKNHDCKAAGCGPFCTFGDW
jgi:hypothetical protein